MGNQLRFLKQCLLMIAISLFFVTEVLAAAAPAGQVLMVAGQAIAKGADGQTRTLERRSTIYVGDTLTTGDKSQAQIRMKDNAMIALGANAEFVVKTYSYKGEGDAKDGAVLTLVKGGLRTISGQIEKSTYKMQTPVATLGIRGTEFDVYVDPTDGTTTVILHDGQVDVTGDGKLVQLIAPGLATIVKKGQAPTTPAVPPQEILDYLREMLGFVPDDVTWHQDEDGNTVFDIGDDIVINIVNDQPPTINGDGDPSTESVQVPCDCECNSNPPAGASGIVPIGC